MPSDLVRFLSLDEAVAIHERLIEAFGGSLGIRDPGLLESALFRPQTGYYADVLEMAAALFESLLMNHPFIDGNKRVAVTVAAAFLRVNGFRMRFRDLEAFELMNSLYEAGTFERERLAEWLRKVAEPLG